MRDPGNSCWHGYKPRKRARVPAWKLPAKGWTGGPRVRMPCRPCPFKSGGFARSRPVGGRRPRTACRMWPLHGAAGKYNVYSTRRKTAESGNVVPDYRGAPTAHEMVGVRTGRPLVVVDRAIAVFAG